LAVTVGSKVFVWGGESSTEEDCKFLQFFDMDTKKWWKRRTKGSPPEGYVACAYTLIGKVLYVFGGLQERRTKGCAYALIHKIFGGQIYYNGIYQVELDLEATTLEWKKCKVRNRKQGPMKKRSTGMIAPLLIPVLVLLLVVTLSCRIASLPRKSLPDFLLKKNKHT